MKKLILLAILTVTLFANDRLNIGTGILPIQYIINAIGKEKVNTFSILQKAQDPHIYTPTPKQMISMSKSDIYFSLNLQFEKQWINKIKTISPNVDFVDLLAKNYDNPHVWLSVKLIKKISFTICETLIKHNPTNKLFFQNNHKVFLNQLKRLNQKITKELKTSKQHFFLTTHPSWGYIADEYNLTQISIEKDGKEPKIKEIDTLIKVSKNKNIKTIISSPYEKSKITNIIARQIDATVTYLDPLKYNLYQNILLFIKSINQ